MCGTCVEIDHYDLIIISDVIEHMFKDEAESVLETLYAQANKLLIVNIPLGEGWIHPRSTAIRGVTAASGMWRISSRSAPNAPSTAWRPACNTGPSSAKGRARRGAHREILVCGGFFAKRGNWENASRYAHRAIALQQETSARSVFWWIWN